MLWTNEMRYRNYRTITETEEKMLLEKVENSIWRQSFHIQPPHGLLNDPNGFTFYNGKYYLFYQWFPFGAVHGMKHWYQVESEDLVNWKDKGATIFPEYDHESHGVFSGSGIVKDDLLYLFYTGNKRDENWNRHASQCLAVMNTENELSKLEEPIISGQPNGYTDNFRDPKVWKDEDGYYMIVGAERENHTGCVLLYYSTDLCKWDFRGELKTDQQQFGHMWECPDLFQIDGEDVLLISPQGLEPDGEHYHNVHNSGCFIGKLDLKKMRFYGGAFQELDAGFDFYAPQTTLAPDGRRILVGWMGLPDTTYPSDTDMWANCLTIPREIRIKNGKIYQNPVKELTRKRKIMDEWQGTLNQQEVMLDQFSGKTFELICDITVEKGTAGVKLRVGEDEETLLYLDTEKEKIVFDRTKSGVPVATQYGTIRKTAYHEKAISFQIFMDISSVEIFINEGECVFTSRIFPKQGSTETMFFANDGMASFAVKKWDYE
ncbi:sucrose-6-phosphate hydrolase [Priestia filamentosa]|uniref:glycoside hydrolase family 32 protein n=1 Tax=Priestia filamentosa TaxID=1402861 RepID=UPI003F173637